MCILLKLHYAKFGVSSFFSSKVIEEKPLRGQLDPWIKEGLSNTRVSVSIVLNLLFYCFCHCSVQKNQI